MTVPMEHILRTALPWRPDEQITECGRDAAEFAVVLTREQAVVKFKDQGVQRAALSTCMVCMHTAQRHATWEDSPASVMSRHATAYYGTDRGNSRLDKELRAIAALIDAHREEFIDYVAGLEAASSLDAKRAERRRR